MAHISCIMYPSDLPDMYALPDSRIQLLHTQLQFLAGLRRLGMHENLHMQLSILTGNVMTYH